jgi:4-hydroxybenzoyl-CoA thioesterase/acyl-CoA thioester hydrolase
MQLQPFDVRRTMSHCPSLATAAPVMSKPFRTTRRVEFRDTDAAGIVHFSVFFNYMEQVEHEFLRTMGLSVIMKDTEMSIAWPRVAARCDYQGPVRFEDEVDVEMHISRLGEKSVTYEFNFSHDGRPVAVGQMTAVCCRTDQGEPLRSMTIPDWISAKLHPFTE